MRELATVRRVDNPAGDWFLYLAALILVALFGAVLVLQYLIFSQML